MFATDRKRAPFGSWLSPISATSLATSPPVPDALLVDDVSLLPYHLERRPLEGGRVTLIDSISRQEVVKQPWNVRTGVHEYGGGAVCIRNAVVHFSHYADGRLYALDRSVGSDAEPVAVTPENKNHRFADFTIHPSLPHILVSVLEDHTHPSPLEVVNKLVIIDTKKQRVKDLASGFDFYASPRFNAEGTRIAWVQWNHPQPWDASEVHVADCQIVKDNGSGDESISIKHEKALGTGPNESAIYPQWLDEQQLLFNSDRTGYENPYVFDASNPGSEPYPLLEHPLEEDFSEPMWTLGESYSAILSAGQVVFATIRSGRGALYRANRQDIKSKYWTLQEIQTPFVRIKSLRATGKSSAMFIGEQADAGAALVGMVIMSDGSLQLTELSTTSSQAVPKSIGVDKSYLSAPEAFCFTDVSGDPVHAVFYPPTNPEYECPDSESKRCPCIINIHGGPTGMASQGLQMKIQFFTSRGVAFCSLNYGGSTGFGRKYMERLDGNWGIADVNDSIAVARYLSSSDSTLSVKVDSSRIAISGGSAGGYTVLQGICTPSALNVFCGAISSYGISNLFNLVKDTHKFEAKYMEKLIGCKVTDEGGEKVYRERSPVFQAERVKTALLLLQGSLDPVVPPEQSKEMARVIKSQGGHVELVMFEGESHGWRKAETIERAAEEEWRFLRGVFGVKDV